MDEIEVVNNIIPFKPVYSPNDTKAARTFELFGGLTSIQGIYEINQDDENYFIYDDSKEKNSTSKKQKNDDGSNCKKNISTSDTFIEKPKKSVQFELQVVDSKTKPIEEKTILQQNTKGMQLTFELQFKYELRSENRI
jgi:hypothetical protein